MNCQCETGSEVLGEGRLFLLLEIAIVPSGQSRGAGQLQCSKWHLEPSLPIPAGLAHGQTLGKESVAENTFLGIPMAQACGWEGLCNRRNLRATDCNLQKPWTLKVVTILPIARVLGPGCHSRGYRETAHVGSRRGPSCWCSGSRPGVFFNIGP